MEYRQWHSWIKLIPAATEIRKSQQVTLGVRNNPGILISGHDLKGLEELLEQTEGTGVDVYTHSEMLPAHYYPQLKKYKHLAGNYGNAWWKQKEEFEKVSTVLSCSQVTVSFRHVQNASYKGSHLHHRSLRLGQVRITSPNVKTEKPKDFFCTDCSCQTMSATGSH